MDYVVGSVAALVSGNVTPNRPRLLKRPLTPTKHQPSPNVTPKSEFVEDRSIFLSPTLQKKKAMVKKSPKRIFENPDLELTENSDTTTPSPKAEKVKKHLKNELDSNSPVKSKSRNSSLSECSSKLEKASETNECQNSNENIAKKKKKKQKSKSDNTINKFKIDSPLEMIPAQSDAIHSPSKCKRRRKSISQSNERDATDNPVEECSNINSKQIALQNEESDNNITPESQVVKTKAKKRKKKSQTNLQKVNENKGNDKQDSNTMKNKNKKINKKKQIKSTDTEYRNSDNVSKAKKKEIINLNAITTKDSDSEHDSDDDIKCQNEEINKKILNTEPEESSSEEEEVPQTKEPKKEVPATVSSVEEIRRTLFVGNIPYSKKCKKDIKKIFGKYGQIETIRIRTVPVKDARYSPKMALIKNELHPDRTTVNAYVKFKDQNSVNEALAENNTVLNENHLRVSRSDTTGAEHDPKLSVFVGNLPFTIEDEVLRSKFENCGEIDSVRIIRDKKTNAGKGFGYINFKSKDGVELALHMSEEDLTIKNRILRVKRCTQQAQTGNKVNRNKPSKFYNQQQNGDGAKGFGNRQMGNRQGGGQNGRQDVRQQGHFGFGNRQTGNRPDRGQQGRPDFRQQGQFSGNQQDGAYRRVMNKRKNQESNDGPPNKRQNFNQPKEKIRKEFVGVTAEKKKKRKFDKGQKKKRALSEILTK